MTPSWLAASRTSPAWSPMAAARRPAPISVSSSVPGITSTGDGPTRSPRRYCMASALWVTARSTTSCWAWFDHFLKGHDNGVAARRRVDYFVMGADTWKSASDWPLPQTQWTTLHLSGPGGITDRKGQLVSAAPGAQPPDTYTYDPAFPAPSDGGHSCCGAQSGPQGPYDQSPVEQRSDVLVYDSAPLDHDTEVTGPVSVRLWAHPALPTPISPPSWKWPSRTAG